MKQVLMTAALALACAAAFAQTAKVPERETPPAVTPKAAAAAEKRAEARKTAKPGADGTKITPRPEIRTAPPVSAKAAAAAEKRAEARKTAKPGADGTKFKQPVEKAAP